MKAPYERGVELSRRFRAWWDHIPEPTYDSSVRAPSDHSLTIIVCGIGMIMVAVVVGQALQRAGVILP